MITFLRDIDLLLGSNAEATFVHQNISQRFKNRPLVFAYFSYGSRGFLPQGNLQFYLICGGLNGLPVQVLFQHACERLYNFSFDNANPPC